MPLRSIRFSVLGLALVPLLFFIVVLAAVLRVGGDARTAEASAQRSDQVLAELRHFEADADTAGAAAQHFLLTGAPAAYVGYRRAAALVPGDASRLRALVADDPSLSKLAGDITTYMFAQLRQVDALLERMRHGNRQAIYEGYVASQLHNTHREQADDRIPAEILQFRRSEEQLENVRRIEVSRLWATLQTIILAAMFGAVLLSIAVGVVLSRRITSRLRALRDQATQFAADGTLPRVISGSDEIAEVSRTLREMAIAVSERSDAVERYRLLAGLAHDAILFLRRSDGWIVEANQAAVALYGFAHDELLSMTIHDLRAPENTGPFDAQMRGGEPFSLHFEAEHRRADGSTFPVEISMQSAYLREEHMVISVVRDIAERREAEAAIRSALHQATEASRLKSEFVATMSHEIRTPMNGVIGMTELLLESDLTREQREFAITARESAHSLLGIINNILDFSKIEAGKTETEISEFDVVAKAEGIASMLSRQAHSKGIGLMSYVDPLIPQRLLGDAMRLRQVLVNLVGNAVKFTERGGVAIIVDPITLAPENVRLRFSVHDSGIGISSDILPKIFEAFQQADGSTTRRFGGTGLGLAISKRLVELMGGELQVESEVGRGSTFSFVLDLRVAEQRARPRREDLRDLHAMIVDDDVMARDIVSRYANSWGMRTSVAPSAEAAFTMMVGAARAGNPYDVAVVDLRLPQADGMELARKIRADSLTKDVKLVLVTAFDEPQSGQRAIRAGFSAYLTKPVRQSQLFDAIIEAVMGQPAAHSAERRVVPETLHGDRILLAEDNEINRQVFVRQLERLGYHAELACDGREAVERAALETFDLIFMDCQMPAMDGFQATREIRRIESRTGRHTQIIALTANALSGDRDACLAAGMDDYLAKPVALADLSRVLAERLNSGTNGASTNGHSIVFDRGRILETFGSDSPDARAFVESAVAQLRQRCERALRVSDAPTAHELLHEIKGAAANIGAEELAQVAERLERRARDGAALPSPSELNELMDAWGRLAAAAQ